ncbi:LytTR family two component transcriptional regulator [Nonlabens dokdonensis]|jgi:DNA-binding response OmpR family regulator|uniref:Histidine kinase response regulator hybrid protein n=2 Tax=Nonlabens dokdonensis TaxID=328515 RepID=L7W7V4_NONDD|nr:response regulator transcription factor [Nonlabens dokdonensis]AGC76239.1 histidine kinase response regulator hybrid protein [Nonlabens dokdonensis DSW-6]PZX43903.1 LytTR family two component transcriptional regulator [Nonlabens dokdonensis]
MKTHVLIVEDEAALYERLRRALVKQNFSVDQYTKSYDDAIERITKERPDVVLLDINLEGKKDGIDLGETLNKQYQIPFIYVTSLDDDITFSKGLHTNHENYLVKTKPRLNIEDITRAINTVIHKNKNDRNDFKKGIIGLVGYLDEIKNMGKDTISRVKINYEDILYFSTKPFRNQNDEFEAVEKNYCWFMTRSGEYYFLRESLSSLSRKLPYHFIRINESYIINISNEVNVARINGSRIKVEKTEFFISATYKKEVNKRLEHFYG